MVGDSSQYQQNIDIEDDTLNYHLLEMLECGHIYVTAVRDEAIREIQESEKVLTRRFALLLRSGDECGARRVLKKRNAKVIQTKAAVQKCWKVKGKEHADESWIPTPLLEGKTATSDIGLIHEDAVFNQAR